MDVCYEGEIGGSDLEGWTLWMERLCVLSHTDDKVKQLEEACRLDLLVEGALPLARLSRRTAAWVAVAVFACLPLRPGLSLEQVSTCGRSHMQHVAPNGQARSRCCTPPLGAGKMSPHPTNGEN
ncbi:hypothetical protein NDU88_004619 [Pleurodeles waltl]|uniref:Uncharacterized protein n=1 Tax=Pleurodeles waltl TaxID=8319 RepID=A0AAV7QID3_PLEWA|nr:hypothetical protein NDU88_004619 [Pleurodeles waltl]